MIFVRRIFSLLILLFLTFLMSRALIRSLPGDPVDTILAETGTSATAETLRSDLKLDQPFISATLEQLELALQGDLGRSILTGQKISIVLKERLLNTTLLVSCSLIIALAIALTLSLGANTEFTSGRLRSFFRSLASFHSALTSAMPTAWIGPIFAYVFAVSLRLFPLGNHILLPSMTLGFAFSGFWTRLLQVRIQETLALGPAQAARARGLSEFKIALKYGLAPCSAGLVAYLGTQIGILLSGAFVTEFIFDWPGMGLLLIEGVLRRDYPVVEVAIFFSAAFSLTGSFLGDWVMQKVDPRLWSHFR